MASTPGPNPTLKPSYLPVGQLESLKFKMNQMLESITTLQRTLDLGGQPAMHAWPDILSKYNILLSQSHNLSSSLVASQSTVAARGVPGPSQNIYERLSLHPTVAMSDMQLDNELIPLLRNQQTTDVLRLENETVRHLAEHMQTRGSLGVLAPANGPELKRIGSQQKRPEYADVLRECEEIRIEHDLRVERAVRAVTMLREKYDWKARVEVDQEEPEELEWDPRLGDSQDRGDAVSVGGQSNDTEDEEELEVVLGNGADQSPEGTPAPESQDVSMTLSS
ncbi:hypothetical protein QCA50_007198 [Cerrena zonata]|uniref:Mediator of RNA polymerase II transcription subunit 8 n=1 Tax=Cerrena zonata TaxID=2478898 RepID=A0AAW0G7U7_9APHY